MRMLSIDKDTLATLPTAKYEQNIKVVNNMTDLKKVCRVLAAQNVIGIDTETRPVFKRGQQGKVALMQLAIDDCSFLIRLNFLGLPKCLTEILENENIIKVGASLKDDARVLQEHAEFTPRSFFELQSYVKEFGILDNALTRIHAILFGERLSKAQRLSNWEANELTEAQQHYAALDAWCCLRIYNYLKNGSFHPEESPYEYVEPENEDPTKQPVKLVIPKSHFVVLQPAKKTCKRPRKKPTTTRKEV